MSEMYSIKIDVKKILKDRMFNANSGAVYLDAIMIPSKSSQYGDSHMIVQSLPKEERDAGKRGPIIGNAKLIAKRGGTSAPSQPATDEEPAF